MQKRRSIRDTTQLINQLPTSGDVADLEDKRHLEIILDWYVNDIRRGIGKDRVCFSGSE
jgi:hypothetical protein